MRGWNWLNLGWTVVGLLIIGRLNSYAQASGPAESVLRQGSWLKIGVTQSGIYRLDQSTLARLNPAFAQADPRLLRLYGNGGAMLPQSNATPRAADLTENAIQVTGESDGRFDTDDALLFFGQSTHAIRYDSTARRFIHQTNVYSDTTFYFLTIGTAAGLRVSEKPAGNVSAAPTVATFTDYQFHELDREKLPSIAPDPSLHSGREWLGEFMTLDTAKTITFDPSGFVANTPVRLRLGAVVGSTSPTQFALAVNGQQAGLLDMTTISGAKYDFRAQSRSDTFRVSTVGDNKVLQVTASFLKRGNTQAQAYLDYVGVEWKRALLMPTAPTWVRRLPGGLVAVKQAGSTLRVWNVTNPLVPMGQGYVLNDAAEARWQTGSLSDYLLFTDGQLQTPASIQAIATQNLRAKDTPDLLIVTADAWKDEAERLAAFRQSHDKLNVLVVTAQQVYNEFGSGQPDPTAIRDAARYFYQKQPGRLRYLLLMGDATYDYRNISRLLSQAELANTIPVYESRESLHPVLSYSSDDYFGFMGVNEGEWPETDQGNYLIDLGVGRLPVRSAYQAKTVVDKLIRYSTDQTQRGDWQAKVLLIADDGDYNLHQSDADRLATQVERQSPTYEPERLFLDSYPQQVTALGPKAPIVEQSINKAVQDGRLIINYNGHGGEDVLAEEQIVTSADIQSWTNRRYPFFVTATCQFGRYDDPSLVSGAEQALLSDKGGAIGLLTTTRPVYANSNMLVDSAFFGAVFRPVDGVMPRLGDMMKATKNRSLSNVNNRNFALLGDPSLRLAYPQMQAVLTRVNSHTLTNSQKDTLRALQSVELAGEIRSKGQLLSSFTGNLRLVLYDKPTTLTTLGTESAKMSYRAFTNTLFVGQVPVRNGQFTARFTMPKDINYTVGRAKVYLYAVQADSLLDALGSYDSLLVGGGA
ncbi:type IX secretion system sortase PorU [Spirosoma rhododendri]|uniref:type IX secretion system sortase PorU n=1 Tax=Spirosoma rhododendri TaxID=2728024 RepID=UPI0020C26C60|nr:type IX secretion system sortase PorU [Spirosoma rhododendri]